MLFEEVEDAGNAEILLSLSFPERFPAHMDVETAGPRLMAGIAQGDGLFADGCPGHLMEMVVQGHGMGDDLKAIVQGAVVLAIDAALTGIIGESQNLRGIPRVLAALVNFQFDTKIAGAASVEDWLRFIVVIMDDALAAGCTLKAVVA